MPCTTSTRLPGRGVQNKCSSLLQEGPCWEVNLIIETIANHWHLRQEHEAHHCNYSTWPCTPRDDGLQCRQMLAMTSARPQFADLFTMLPGLAVWMGVKSMSGTHTPVHGSWLVVSTRLLELIIMLCFLTSLHNILSSQKSKHCNDNVNPCQTKLLLLLSV